MSRRTLGTIAAVAMTALLVSLVAIEVHHASSVKLPLSDASIIRKQAAAKHLDPALIAAVIYAESKFEPRPSSAGAQGLMQILPATAYYLAHLSRASSGCCRRPPVPGQLATVEDRAGLQARLRLHPHRRSAEGDRRASRGHRAGRALPDAARGDWHGQDDGDGGRDRGGSAPDAGDRSQQDARRAAASGSARPA